MVAVCFFSCSDEETSKKDQAFNAPNLDISVPAEEEKIESVREEFPIVFIEELDQTQEFYKEQHETSFSHIPKKNWMSFTAGKDGILTKILLFGKPNYIISEHYGSAMSGSVRASNPDRGPKFGSWEISRDDIVNQLAGQSLTETEAGWITLRMRGEIPMEAGKTYFLICEKIADGKPWFGAFAFGEGNPYRFGRHWLHPGHDLVFRTYVGKTQKQIEREQKIILKTNSSAKKEFASVSPNLPPPPIPRTISPLLLDKADSGTIEKTTIKEVVTFTPTEKKSFDLENSNSSETLRLIEFNPMDANDSKEIKQKSLFDRLFKKTTE